MSETKKELWLAIEGGGTKTRLYLSDTDRKVLAREVGGTSSSLYVQAPDYEAYASRMRVLLRNIRETADDACGRVTVVGLAAPMVQELVTKLVREVLGAVEFVFTSEAAIALACHDLSSGVSMVAGTGAGCVALNEEGLGAGCGGFGPQFGDEGSGYWIGREAIAAAMRENDGRGPETALTRALCAFYGIGHILEIYKFRDPGGHVSGPKVASCVPVVFETARAGDSVARAVCRGAGHALGHTIVATVRRAGITERPVPVVLTGGVFNGGALILTPLRRVLRRSGIEFKLFPVVTEPGEGILKVIEKQRQGVS
ncbi:MAG TPA: BadF/BadG/BcrA/BcrD ATPase family protein [Candidatus Hydrogenedentes bacterium]|nr:BadF/BadG/BcrA/BcrD ATPase family protein [Candidatus Hydrogenedentota bacterium]HQE84081.1 BadF/BadG/BcrA/BcrD ATPase family protein [Candidatus Hydrogenedentota bacterium]HQH51139.1 BadF/BadG/BcrA/BcrD ATPase family protein [Candidatus Hydrogenedentota bacterium]HQM47445.1 BadF/BadG/BcrA/BcrD ATPase family protein [Candidatus Hydrogenedentota bacterium]